MSDMIDIDDVACEKILLEDCGPSLRPRWIEARRGALGDTARNPFLAWHTMPDVRIHAWRLRDVVLDATTMLLLHDGRIIRQSNYQRHAHELADMRVDPDRLEQIDTATPVLICGDAWCTNHFHFLNHTLPAIDSALTRHGRDGVVLAAHTLRPVHQRMLHMLGHAAAPVLRLQHGRQYRIASAEFCAYTVGAADFANAAHIQALHDRLAAQVPAGGGHGRKIYVSRLADKHRHAGGEADLVHALSRRGFSIVAPADMSLPEQIATFRAARLVVGPHGAGLANISFCQPEAEIYDLLPRHFIDPSILNLAIRRGARAWVDAFASDASTTDHTRDWTLDVPAVLARLDEIDPRHWLRACLG
jgi:capsular polysaccharide biosynthesis protein